MSSIPLEVWGRILFFVSRLPPQEEAADPLVARWEDYSQADLARCMRVSSAFYFAASRHLYRCATTNDLPLFLYGTANTEAPISGDLDIPSEHDPAGSHHRSTPVSYGRTFTTPHGDSGPRTSKAQLLALVRRLHVLQPSVTIPGDISLRLAFSGWCSLHPTDHAVVLAAVQAVLEPIAGLLHNDALHTALPNLSRVAVASCNEYTWRSLELGGTGIPAFQALLRDCRQVVPALLARRAPGRCGRGGVAVEWVQQATHGPFVLPPACIVDLTPPAPHELGREPRSDTFAGVFISDQQCRACCFPPIVSGVCNVIKYGESQRDRWGSDQGLIKALVKMLEEVGRGFEDELQDGTVLVLEGLLGRDGSVGNEAQTGGDAGRHDHLGIIAELDAAVGSRWKGRVRLG